MSAILKAGHIPAGMELFTAGDKSQMDTIKRWIDESDVYMLILGGRYGSVEPMTSLSYTELEYDYAVEQAKPLFAVVIDEATLEDKVKSNGTTFIERENPRQLKQFRDKVLSRISSFFKSDADIKLCVHESLADFRENPELKGWVSASEIEDTSLLHDEIVGLRAEIARLQKEAKFSSGNNGDRNDEKSKEYDDLFQILSDTILNLPKNSLEPGDPTEADALALFLNNQDPLITGVTNAANANEVETFFYHNLAPKLMRHGLMANEKVANARFRRSYVTAKGLAFLEEFERRKNKRPKGAAAKAPVQANRDAPKSSPESQST